MYCSSCGVAVAQGLRFCNHCGAGLNLSKQEMEPREIRLETIIAAMAFVFVFGLAATALLVLLLSDSVHLLPGQVMGFAAFSLLTMLVLESVFITLLFRRKPRTKETHDSNQFQKPITKELNAMSEGTFGVPSVTEHTTRAFDPVYIDRSKE